MLSAETESFKEDNDIGTVTWNTAYYFQKKKREREREHNRSVVVRKEIPHSLRYLKKIPILTFVNHYVI